MKISKLLKRLGELRDGMLVTGTAVYLLGYLTWSYYAWREGLGPVAALDAQYFAAGIPICLVLLATVASIIGLRHVAETRWRPYFQNKTEGHQQLLNLALLLTALGLTVVFFYLLVTRHWVVLPTLMMVGGYVIIHLYGAGKQKPDIFARFAPTVVLILVGMGIAMQFATSTYQTIPDALGGGRSRRVTLDIRADALSPITVNKLLDVSAQPPTGDVVHTRELSIIASQGDYYLILIPATEHEGSGERIQLQRTAVQAISWQQ
jgi:hypothetical protein